MAESWGTGGEGWGSEFGVCRCFGLTGGFSFGAEGLVGVAGTRVGPSVEGLKPRSRSGFGAGDRGPAGTGAVVDCG